MDDSYNENEAPYCLEVANVWQKQSGLVRVGQIDLLQKLIRESEPITRVQERSLDLGNGSSQTVAKGVEVLPQRHNNKLDGSGTVLGQPQLAAVDTDSGNAKHHAQGEKKMGKKDLHSEGEVFNARHRFDVAKAIRASRLPMGAKVTWMALFE